MQILSFRFIILFLVVVMTTFAGFLLGRVPGRFFWRQTTVYDMSLPQNSTETITRIAMLRFLLKQQQLNETKARSKACKNRRQTISNEEKEGDEKVLLMLEEYQKAKGKIHGGDPECNRMLIDYEVVPYVSWGKLPVDLHQQWKKLQCDVNAGKRVLFKLEIPPHWAITSVVKNQMEKIAVCIPVCTRGIKVKNMDDLALFRSLLPSISKTIVEGFVYWIYIAYDEGDGYFDDENRLNEVKSWFYKQITIKQKKEKNIEIILRFHKFKNTEHKPGPVFNSMTQQAYKDGATWIYRVNDDSMMLTPWAKEFTDELKRFGPPFGAVGPWCNEGNVAILTHDFTHRTHLDIFPTYYPIPLSDWWMDDWITRVYGRSRTKRLKSVVVLHSESHGTRYSVDPEHQKMLPIAIENGHKRIVEYMKVNNYSKAKIALFEADATDYAVINGR